MTITPPPPQVQRDRWGRPLVIPPGGGKPVPYRRCTTFIDVLDDRHALERWKQRQVAIGMATRHDLVLKAASAAGDKKLLDEVCAAATEAAGASMAATTGSAVHAITEQVDRGQTPAIPPGVQADIDAYVEATTGLRMAEIEVFVVNDTLRVGGTFDRIVEHAGRRYVADIKTGNVDYNKGKIAMQLAVYAGSQRYNPATGEREPLHVDQDQGLVIHLPAGAGKCTVWWVSLADGRTGVDIARRVWEWRDTPHDFTHQYTPLLQQIRQADSVDALRQLWARYRKVWTDELTAAAAARKEELGAAAPSMELR